jgi:hypothetical protein
LLLPSISQGCIVTTNFDNAIEETFRRKKIAFDSYMHGTQQNNFFSKLVHGQRCILKLHGDAEDSQSYVLTDEQYTEAYGNPIDYNKNLPKALRQIYISNSLLFIGCSLEKDRTCELFYEIKSYGEYEIPLHYAFLSDNDDIRMRRDKEDALLEINIQPIWYPKDQHEYIKKLLFLAIDLANNRITLH